MPKAPEAVPAFQRYQLEFARHIRDPKNSARPAGAQARRMNVYNALLYHNLESSLLACFPVSRQTLGKRKWQSLVRAFFATHRCHTPFFRRIPEEFIQYLESRSDGAPPWLRHLAHYEWVELALDTSAQEIDRAAFDEAGDLMHGRPALNPVRFLLHYPFAVHKISPRSVPKQEEPTHFLVFRDLRDRVHFVVLNSFSARLVQLLEPGQLSGHKALSSIAVEHPGLDAQAVYAGGMQTLEDLRRDQAILGAWKGRAVQKN